MSKFIPWVSDGNVVENTNVYDYSNFNGVNSQSKNGFQSGNIISSTYINSALRQANLVVAALMEATGNNTLDLTSSVADVKTALQTYFTGLYVARATSDGSGNNIASTYATQTGTYSDMTVGNATNSTNATYASKAVGDSGTIPNTYARKDGTYSSLIAGSAQKIEYTTTAPSSSPASGTLVIYVGTSLPSTRYDRVLYLVKGA